MHGIGNTTRRLEARGREMTYYSSAHRTRVAFSCEVDRTFRASATLTGGMNQTFALSNEETQWQVMPNREGSAIWHEHSYLIDRTSTWKNRGVWTVYREQCWPPTHVRNIIAEYDDRESDRTRQRVYKTRLTTQKRTNKRNVSTRIALKQAGSRLAGGDTVVDTRKTQTIRT